LIARIRGVGDIMIAENVVLLLGILIAVFLGVAILRRLRPDWPRPYPLFERPPESWNLQFNRWLKSIKWWHYGLLLSVNSIIIRLYMQWVYGGPGQFSSGMRLMYSVGSFILAAVVTLLVLLFIWGVKLRDVDSIRFGGHYERGRDA